MAQNDDPVHRPRVRVVRDAEHVRFFSIGRWPPALRLRLGIERRGGLVQHKDRCIPDEGPCDSQALSLAPRERHTALANACVPPFGSAVMNSCACAAVPPLALISCAARPAKRDILRHA
ncbi:MAG: hypothetical protein Ct9H300mP7_4510 [Verrucomicrobiota bacterium]|nr:MAG: hypothetical protein Ct9H300mP7_4510 [Verrucomicrobiota bacterium]